MANKVIGFWDDNLGLRGTSVAIYDYARYNEEILGNVSFIFSKEYGDLSAREKFERRFPGRVRFPYLYDCEQILLNEYPDHEPYFYIIKAGDDAGGVQPTIKTLVHAVFAKNNPHGHRYCYVSDWLATHMGYNPETHAVPHIVDTLPQVTGDLREELGIPRNARVFGCYGGSTEFSVRCAHEVMQRVVRERNDIYFIFMNILPYHGDIRHDHPNIKFLPGSWDLTYKSLFISTCDAMLHARLSGETFGCAVGEFSVSGKPVLTYGHSGERSHLEILGEKALVYNNFEELYDMVNHLDDYLKYDDYNCYRNFAPDIIMRRFEQNFLN